MVDKAAEGAVGEPFDLDVERGKIYEFARAIRSQNPAYFAETPICPPTFLTTMLMWEKLVEASNPWHRVAMSEERGVHGEQEYVFHGPPPRAGTRLRCRSRIERIFEKQGGRGGKLTFAVMVTEFVDDAGKLVAEAKLTGIETEKPPEAGAGDAEGEA